MAAMLAVILIGVSEGGCSFRLGSMFEKDKSDASDVTGSIGSVVRIKDDTNLTDADMALARNAASDILSRGGKDASQPWENPETGARGSVTPLATTYASEGRVCRDFVSLEVAAPANPRARHGHACHL